jgi:excisionase family DNA binding protein
MDTVVDRASPPERMAYSIKEAAERLGMSRGHLYQMAKQGDIHSLRIGRRVVIPRKVLDDMLQTGEDQEAK